MSPDTPGSCVERADCRLEISGECSNGKRSALRFKHAGQVDPDGGASVFVVSDRHLATRVDGGEFGHPGSFGIRDARAGFSCEITRPHTRVSHWGPFSRAASLPGTGMCRDSVELVSSCGKIAWMRAVVRVHRAAQPASVVLEVMEAETDRGLRSMGLNEKAGETVALLPGEALGALPDVTQLR